MDSSPRGRSLDMPSKFPLVFLIRSAWEDQILADLGIRKVLIINTQIISFFLITGQRYISKIEKR